MNDNLVYENIVIGSGPAGIAAAIGLTNLGKKCHIIDWGNSADDKQGEELTLPKLEDDVPLKLFFGSDFPYRLSPHFGDLHLKGIDVLPSHAKGGFSNVWGACVLPYHQIDLKDWPLDSIDFSGPYKKIAELMKVSGRKDDLEDYFPAFTNKPAYFPQSVQAENIFLRSRRNHSKLKSSGIKLGYSRLAANFNKACERCGNCLTGCPKDLIFNSTSELQKLIFQKKVTYESKIHVVKIEEFDDIVKIIFYRDNQCHYHYIKCRRAFLATGPIATTKIMFNSWNGARSAFSLKDSQYFLLPALAFSKNPSRTESFDHTLAQLFLEIDDPAISQNLIHFQIYTHNSIMEKHIRDQLGVKQFFIEPIMNNIIILQGYLHSDYSSTIEAYFHSEKTLTLTCKENIITRKTIRKALKKLQSHFNKLGFMPISLACKIAKPGRGYHIGGSIPMAKDPIKFQSNTLGVPSGFKRLHIVDAAVFPTIPATTITFAVMANAYRTTQQVYTHEV